jgi:ADP-dependent NAD(P)H-hydrate dehydratase / NAD(P)H-hydrate epimerase
MTIVGDNALAATSVPIWSADCAKAIDKLSIDAGVKSSELMEQAGSAAAEVIAEEFFPIFPVIIFVGPGNNGGDGLVVARHLVAAGYKVAVVLVFGSKKSGSKDFAEQLKRAQENQVQIQHYETGKLPFSDASSPPPVIVDAIFGLGFSGKIEDKTLRQCITEINAMRKRAVVAIDLPTGVIVDDFEKPEIAVQTDITVTFGALKPAHVVSPARSVCGETIVKKIGFSPEVESSVFQKSKIDLRGVHRSFFLDNDPRDCLGADIHKFSRGHVLIIGGSEGKSGAPIMCGQACLRAGAGWVTVATSEQSKGFLPLELTSEDFFASGVIQCKRLEEFVEQRQVKAMVIGSGAVTNPLDEATMAALARINSSGVFLVLDAAALHKLAPLLEKFPLNPERAVVTPHPGEWKKFGKSFPAITSLRQLETVLKDLERWGVSLIYKTATPMVLSPIWGSVVAVAEGGTNALARAGSGDVLAGTIAAFGALGENAPSAALKGQLFLNQTAHNLSQTYSQHGITSVDLIQGLSFRQS